MKIKVISRGSAEFRADGVYQEQPIGIAIASRDDAVIRSEIIDSTDTARSDISYDQYAVVTEDDGTELWRGWLTGDPADAPPAESSLDSTETK